MRILAAILFVFGAVAYAELPDIVQDPSSRETMEYLDAKASRAISVAKDYETAVKNFQSANSTTTFNGWVDIGRETTTGATSIAAAYAYCNSGKYIIGGGCSANATLNASYPASDTSWYCAAPGATSTTAYAICARVK